jgi:hypothetical protein
MNKRDIELVLQAGLGKPYVSKTRCTSGVKINDVDALQRFAALIRADEREACAKVCESYLSESPHSWGGTTMAAAIRARGQA